MNISCKTEEVFVDNHLKKLYNFLMDTDKSAATFVDSMIKKSSDPYDAPDLWEMNPEDQEGIWETSGLEMPEDRTGIEMLPDAGGLVSQEEIIAFREFLNVREQEFQSALPVPSGTGRKRWKVFSTDTERNPVELPRKETKEWDIWEVYPGEFGYNEGVEVVGTDVKIYGVE